jgi:hypothetical protein
MKRVALCAFLLLSLSLCTVAIAAAPQNAPQATLTVAERETHYYISNGLSFFDG